MAQAKKKIRKVCLLSDPEPLLLVVYLPDEPEVLQKLYDLVETELASQSKLKPILRTSEGMTARELKKKGYKH